MVDESLTYKGRLLFAHTIIISSNFLQPLITMRPDNVHRVNVYQPGILKIQSNNRGRKIPQLMH